MRIRFGIKTLFVVSLLVAMFFAGQLSMFGRIQREKQQNVMLQHRLQVVTEQLMEEVERKLLDQNESHVEEKVAAAMPIAGQAQPRINEQQP